MKIPNEFNLGGNTVKVVPDNKLLHDNDWLGSAIYREDKIKIQTSTKERPISKITIQQTFCHELVHWILYSMGEHEKNKDEKFVDLFATFLHQALTSMKYKENIMSSGKDTYTSTASKPKPRRRRKKKGTKK